MALALAGCAGKSQPTAGNSTPEINTGNAAGQLGQSSQTNDSGLEKIKKALAGLVADGTFTQDQADKVTQAYSQAYANGTLPIQELWIDEGKLDAQVRANGSLRIQEGSGQQNSGQIQGPILGPLVANGTLNQSQVNAFIKAIRQIRGSKSGDGGGG